MDANGNIIPIVEGDQGEGAVDPLEDYHEKAKEFIEEKGKEVVESVEEGKKISAKSSKALLDTKAKLKKNGLTIEEVVYYNVLTDEDIEFDSVEGLVSFAENTREYILLKKKKKSNCKKCFGIKNHMAIDTKRKFYIPCTCRRLK